MPSTPNPLHGFQVDRARIRTIGRDLQHRITVPDDVAARARTAIERMVRIGGTAAASPFGPEDPGE